MADVLYNRAMMKDSGDQNIQLSKLENLLNEFIRAAADQKEYIDKHTAAMEKLTEAINRLDKNVKKEISLESHKATLDLDELIRMFVEQYINPRYYRQFEHKQLKSSNDLTNPNPPTKREHPKKS